MTLIRYVGPFDAVDIPDVGVTVEQGKTVDVPADVAKALLKQAENFTAKKES